MESPTASESGGSESTTVCGTCSTMTPTDALAVDPAVTTMLVAPWPADSTRPFPSTVATEVLADTQATVAPAIG